MINKISKEAAKDLWTYYKELDAQMKELTDKVQGIEDYLVGWKAQPTPTDKEWPDERKQDAIKECVIKITNALNLNMVQSVSVSHILHKTFGSST